MVNYNTDLLGVSKTRWTGSGIRVLASGHHIIYCGKQNNQHISGVAIIMTNKLKKSLLEQKPISDRLMFARFNSKFAKMPVIVCYAPTEDKEDGKKIYFMTSYKKLSNRYHHMMLCLLLVI